MKMDLLGSNMQLAMIEHRNIVRGFIFMMNKPSMIARTRNTGLQNGKSPFKRTKAELETERYKRPASGGVAWF
jgi:hypothetical protein